MGLRHGKLLLRDVAAELLPPGTMTRGKRGFSIPLDAWLRRDLTETIRDVLSEAAVRRRGVFDAFAVSALVNRYLDGDARLSPPVTMLFAFEQWARRVLDGAPAAPAERASEVAGPAPELSVIIVIRPGNRPGGAGIVHNADGGDFGEGPIPLIMEEEVLE